MYIAWPNKAKQLASIRRNADKQGFPGIIGALDGTHIQIVGPQQYVPLYIILCASCLLLFSFFQRSAADYFCRKHKHTIILQAVVDAIGRFIDVYAGWPGSVSDARVFRNSDLFLKISKDKLKMPDGRAY